MGTGCARVFVCVCVCVCVGGGLSRAFGHVGPMYACKRHELGGVTVFLEEACQQIESNPNKETKFIQLQQQAKK